MIARRELLAAAGAGLALPLAPRALLAQAGDDWAMFDQLSRAFAALLQAPYPIADHITQVKFVSVLRDVQTWVERIVTAKRETLDLLQDPTCRPSYPTSGLRVAAAAEAADRIVPAVDRLADAVATLQIAIRPKGVSDAVPRIVDGCAR